MPATALSALRTAVLVAAAVLALSAGPVFAQLGDPSGPGQPVPLPAAQCPRTVGCQYAERNYLPDGYRFQMLQICGANCTSQYWVTNIPDGQALLTIEPVRGGGIVAVGPGSGPDDMHPPVRTVLPDYAPSDPACCPSQYRDTTYTWDAASGALVAGDPTVVPAPEFAGWDNVRANLESEQFFEVFRGL